MLSLEGQPDSEQKYTQAWGVDGVKRMRLPYGTAPEPILEADPDEEYASVEHLPAVANYKLCDYSMGHSDPVLSPTDKMRLVSDYISPRFLKNDPYGEANDKIFAQRSSFDIMMEGAEILRRYYPNPEGIRSDRFLYIPDERYLSMTPLERALYYKNCADLNTQMIEKITQDRPVVSRGGLNQSVIAKTRLALSDNSHTEIGIGVIKNRVNKGFGEGVYFRLFSEDMPGIDLGHFQILLEPDSVNQIGVTVKQLQALHGIKYATKDQRRNVERYVKMIRNQCLDVGQSVHKSSDELGLGLSIALETLTDSGLIHRDSSVQFTHPHDLYDARIGTDLLGKMRSVIFEKLNINKVIKIGPDDRPALCEDNLQLLANYVNCSEEELNRLLTSAGRYVSPHNARFREQQVDFALDMLVKMSPEFYSVFSPYPYVGVKPIFPVLLSEKSMSKPTVSSLIEDTRRRLSLRN